MASNVPRVSVIIPAYNEASYIDRLLEALTKQSFRDLEVIVSDAQSKDGTAEVVKAFRDKLNARFIESPPKGPAHGRNVGAHAANGEWLLFLDADDDIEDREFISVLLAVASGKGWCSASAKVRVKNANWAERIGNWANYRYIRLLAHTRHPVAPGWCILTKRTVFEDAGGFNEKIRFGEDYDYISRVGHLGFGFVDQTSYIMDLRRARAEGIRFALKGIKNEVYRHTHGYNLENNPHKYEFGKHQKRSK